MPRRSLQVRLSTEAIDGWYEFSTRHGVTLTTLLEVVGAELGRGQPWPSQRQLVSLVADARATDTRRRRKQD